MSKIPYYQCQKVVQAFLITAQDGRWLFGAGDPGHEVKVSEEYITCWPRPVGGYFIRNPDGVEDWNTVAEFERDHKEIAPVTDDDFDEPLGAPACNLGEACESCS